MNNMNKEFIPYEQALALKELGFDEPCFASYSKVSWSNDIELLPPNDNFSGEYPEFKTITNIPIRIDATDDRCSAPTYSQAFRWFREKHNLDSYIKHLYKSTIKVGYYFNIDRENGIEFDSMEGTLDYGYFKTYEEAELECLKKLIEIVK